MTIYHEYFVCVFLLVGALLGQFRLIFIRVSEFEHPVKVALFVLYFQRFVYECVIIADKVIDFDFVCIDFQQG